ncbi:MAG: class I SAM-dependent RNA methyltransferase [Alphaproteobacteria bacterium]|nr:class I SAM-dependent RNA methyltransferase [Alphaproteobacteria bacterium]
MSTNPNMEIFLSATPGLESALLSEVKALGFAGPEAQAGGITISGNWHDAWRANLMLRGASHVLVRLGSFRALHLAQLDKRARKFPWAETLRADVPVRVEVTCKKSRIYHHKAAAQRIETAIQEELGAQISADADVCIKARIFDDMCTISVDTSGEPLHKRGFKQAVNRAPMRENLAALLLRECGFDGTEPVLDPMCGSGTFIIEAAEMALGLSPGRERSFAFEKLATYDDARWQKMKTASDPAQTRTIFYGFDRDGGAPSMSRANAERAGVANITRFDKQTISELVAPEGPAGLVIVNPPYGTRIGDVKKLMPLYQSLGKVLQENFKGWRVGLATNNEKLAHATGLSFGKQPVTFSHGGLRVTLYQTPTLK